MKLYIVGSPIRDLTSTMFFSLQGRKIDAVEVARSLFSQSSVYLFTSLEDAKACAIGLRNNADEYYNFPKNSIIDSKIRPVITVELKDNINLGKQHTQVFTYMEDYKIESGAYKTGIKQRELVFYTRESKLIDKNCLDRADFYGPYPIPSIDFKSIDQSSSCVLS